MGNMGRRRCRPRSHPEPRSWTEQRTGCHGWCSNLICNQRLDQQRGFKAAQPCNPRNIEACSRPNDTRNPQSQTAIPFQEHYGAHTHRPNAYSIRQRQHLRHRPRHKPRDSQRDESIIINYSTQNIIIPSLLSRWRTKVKTAGTFESSARFRPSPLEGIALQGEHQLGLSPFPAPSSSNRISYFPPASARHPDILIVAEHHLHILAAPLAPAPKEPEPSTPLEKSAKSAEK